MKVTTSVIRWLGPAPLALALILAVLGFAWLTQSTHADQPVTLEFSPATGGSLQFDGDDPGPGETGSFHFLGDFTIVDVDSDDIGDSIGLTGSLSGTWNIGPITTSGGTQSAMVTGSGTISISDGRGGFLTATIEWNDIETIGASGSLNGKSQVGLSNVKHSGNSIQDFIDFASSDVGVPTLTFEFSTPTSLTQLTQDGTTNSPEFFVGSLSNSQPPPQLTIAEVVDLFDDTVADGTLTGSGSGNSAAGRLNALRNMLLTADELLDQLDVAGACAQLQDAADRTDGTSPPPDFVHGEAAEELFTMITALRDELGCE